MTPLTGRCSVCGREVPLAETFLVSRSEPDLTVLLCEDDLRKVLT